MSHGEWEEAMKKLFAAVLTFTMIAGLTTGCGNTYRDSDSANVTNGGVEVGSTGGLDETSEKQKEITYAVSVDAVTLDTSKQEDDKSHELTYMAFAGLLRSYNGKTQPDVADSYDISEDGTVYTFHLRKTTWSDGKALTAENFRYAFERLLDPNTASSMADQFYAIKNARAFNIGEITDPAELGVKVIDEYTLEITLEYPQAYFITRLASNYNVVPLRQDIVEKYGDEYASDPSKMVFNGPFIIESVQTDAETVLVKNSFYWDKDSIKLDKITRLVIPDGNTRIAMFNNGEIDGTAEVPASAQGAYEDAQSTLFGALRSLQINVNGMTEETSAIMSNQNFIHALSYAIDREAITQAVGGAGSVATNRVNLPVLAGLDGGYFVDEYPIDNLVPLTGDASRANQYLDQALTELGLTRETMPKITVLTFESEKFKLMAEAYIDTWSQVLNLDCFDLVQYPTPTAIQNCQERQYDIYLQSFGSDLDPAAFISNWVTTGGINWTGYSDAAFDKMISGTENMIDPAKRYAAICDAEEYFLQNGPQIPIFYVGGIYLIRDGISGYYYGPYGATEQWIYCDFE